MSVHHLPFHGQIPAYTRVSGVSKGRSCSYHSIPHLELQATAWPPSSPSPSSVAQTTPMAILIGSTSFSAHFLSRPLCSE